MKVFDAILLGIVLVLAAGVALCATRIAEHHQTGGRWRSEVGRIKVSSLEPATRDRLEGLTDRLVLTYYVSDRSHMPSHMKRVERDVVDLLEAMKAAAPDRFAYHIVDPETDRDQVVYASKRKVAPFRERSVFRDSWSERLIWSTLTIAYGTGNEVIVNGITPAYLPRLQATIVEHLDHMERPRQPVIALAAPAGFDELRGALAEYGQVRRVDLDGDEAFPEDADVLFWMRPAGVTPRRLRELNLFLERGRSVVVAGSELAIGPQGIGPAADGRLALTVERSDFAAEALYASFGLKPVRGLVLDHRSDKLNVAEEPVPAPFLVTCIAPNHDFETWRNQPNGTLLFHAPTPLGLDAEVLAALGYEARVLATTSDKTWLQSPPLDAPRPLDEMGEDRGEPVSKQPLIVSLEHNDPWRGWLVAMAATTPFEDGYYSRGGVAHWRLLKTLVGELTTPERLVAVSADVKRSDPLPPLTGTSRIFWRGLVLVLLPALVAAIAISRGVFRTADRGAKRRVGAGGARVWPRAALGLLVALVVARAAGALGFSADATADGVNSLAGETRAIAARAGDAGETRVELIFSGKRRLPPAMRPLLGRARGALRDLERAGADLDVVTIDPDGLEAAEREQLAAEGVSPVQITARDEEEKTVRTVYSTLRLSRGDRVELLRFDDAAAFEYLEFRLAFALWRLETGERPVIAFAADAERPSAAEAFEKYQQKSLFAPKGTDHYSLARDLLERLDFEVVNVTPRDFISKPEIPADASLLVWMQPRRSITAMMEKTVRYLHGGGNVLLAAQHFNILSRQYRGREFQMSYWPRPQSPDVEQVYFPDVGITMVREVLFDELYTEITVDTEVIGRGAQRDYERQVSAREFQIRASAANFADDSLITRSLGDQAFIWANHFDLDEEKLRGHGLTSKVLMTTTAKTWHYLWKGGFLEEGQEPITGPPRDDDGEPVYAGKLPLAVLVEGTFPKPARRLNVRFGAPGTDASPDEEKLEEEYFADFPPSAPGRLVMVGCSQVFQDERLHDETFRGDHLLVNAVAELALEPELAAIATRHPVVRGFDFVEPETRFRWRTVVLAAPPALFLLIGLGFALNRLRSPAGGAA